MEAGLVRRAYRRRNQNRSQNNAAAAMGQGAGEGVSAAVDEIVRTQSTLKRVAGILSFSRLLDEV